LPNALTSWHELTLALTRVTILLTVRGIDRAYIHLFLSASSTLGEGRTNQWVISDHLPDQTGHNKRHQARLANSRKSYQKCAVNFLFIKKNKKWLQMEKIICKLPIKKNVYLLLILMSKAYIYHSILLKKYKIWSVIRSVKIDTSHIPKQCTKLTATFNFVHCYSLEISKKHNL